MTNVVYTSCPSGSARLFIIGLLALAALVNEVVDGEVRKTLDFVPVLHDVHAYRLAVTAGGRVATSVDEFFG
jgi:hypothetical protein